MPTRREVLKGGLGVLALGAGGSVLGAQEAVRSIVGPIAQRSGGTSTLGAASLKALKASRPLGARSFDPKARIIDGFAFRSWFEGDDFEEEIPFHSQQNDFPGGEPPAPSEEIDVVVIGGGLSGLAAAYELRQYNPVVFELHDIFGGNAQGGRINGAPFSLGSAYFITPDAGGELDRFYGELGLHEVIRADEIASPVEIDGVINPDIWSGLGVPKEDIPAYEAYRQLVIRMTLRSAMDARARHAEPARPHRAGDGDARPRGAGGGDSGVLLLVVHRRVGGDLGDAWLELPRG
jgi:hypothetical protein